MIGLKENKDGHTHAGTIEISASVSVLNGPLTCVGPLDPGAVGPCAGFCPCAGLPLRTIALAQVAQRRTNVKIACTLSAAAMRALAQVDLAQVGHT